MGSSAPIEEAEHLFARPIGPASEVVRRYEAHTFSGMSAGVHRGLPSRALTFRFSLGEPTEITSTPDPRQAPGKFFAFVGGVHTSPALIAHSGSGRGIGVDVSPLVSRWLFGIPAGSLASVVVELDELFGASITTELCDRLQAAVTWHERFRVLDEVLGRLASTREPPLPPPEVVEAWRCIVASRGGVSVEALAAHVGWSRRHLASRFNTEIGFSPKVAMRVVRFEWACELLLTNACDSLADVAAKAGFYDQSHLTREWSDLAGCSPTAWLAEEIHDPPRLDEEVPFVQDVVRRAVGDFDRDRATAVPPR